MAPQCQAKNISNEQQCTEVATAASDLFCKFHAKQAFGLYKGYKRRNAQLDDLTADPPAYLAQTKSSLATQDFRDVEEESTLTELFRYLFHRHQLFERVIRARKLHHSRFYSPELVKELDYGHEAYLHKLEGQYATNDRALGRVTTKLMEMRHKNHKWFEWTRERQLAEENEREKEKVRVKAENAFWKRRQKERDAGIRLLREKEQRQQQDVYLDHIWRESLEAQADDEAWDPIEDVLAAEQVNYVNMIRRFLWLEEESDLIPEVETAPDMAHLKVGDAIGEKENEPGCGNDQTSKKKKKNKNKKQAEASAHNRMSAKAEQPKKDAIETQVELRQRLLQGDDHPSHSDDTSAENGWHVLPSNAENPDGLMKNSSKLTEPELDELMPEIIEIKHLLFCRLLLSNAALLPAALKAETVEEFLDNKDLSTADLRDLCLKMEQPPLQEVRDACADLKRGVEEESFGDSIDSDDDIDEDEDEDEGGPKRMFAGPLRMKYVPKKWKPKRDSNRKLEDIIPEETAQELIDFGILDDEGKFSKKKMRIKICGRSIWNYSSESAMSRRGWLHFCAVAKDCDLNKAIELCRSWNEFAELNMLVMFGYFPSLRWRAWFGDHSKQQLLLHGFVPYRTLAFAVETTTHQQVGGRGVGRRQHFMVEARNIICAHVKRNSLVSRRCLQYLAMNPSRALVLVRDGKTGKVVASPLKEQMWLRREKIGLGRASKNPWKVTEEVDESFFEKSDQQRKWHCSFSDYYDVYIWSATPGEEYIALHQHIHTTLLKAHRTTGPNDLYSHQAPILKTLVRDPITHRPRDMKSGEDLSSIWDEIQTSNLMTPPEMESGVLHRKCEWHTFYNEADALEDAILFPDETETANPTGKFKSMSNPIDRFTDRGPIIARFAQDLDYDEDLHISDDDSNQEHVTNDGNESSSDVDSNEEDPRWNSGVEAMYALNDLVNGQGRDEELMTADVRDIRDKRTNVFALISRWNREEVGREENVEEALREYIDRDKSPVWKTAIHLADFEPGGHEKHREAERLLDALKRKHVNSMEVADYCLLTLRFLEQSPAYQRHCQRDIIDAFAKVCPYFPNQIVASISKFLETEEGKLFKDSALFKKEERANAIPDKRSHTSNCYMPKDFFNEWDGRLKVVGNSGRDDVPIFAPDKYPTEWDVGIRPILAKLYKDGIIYPSNEPPKDAPGMAVYLVGPSRPVEKRDLFIDYRALPHPDQLNQPSLLQPHEYPDLLACARDFAKTNCCARFALLRIYSNAYFYPLMLGVNNRQNTSFVDGLGRPWEWKFVPKDMPGSEWSIHHSLELQFQPFKKILGIKGRPGYRTGVAKEDERVILMRDIVLVMAPTEKKLLKLATCATYAAQARPWLREVDMWKSFVNVDLQVLEGLDRYWLE